MRLLLCAILSIGIPVSVRAQPQGILPPGIALPLGSSLGGGDDALFSVNLPFMFPFPDGTSASSLDISTNGIIYPGGFGIIDPSESVAEFESRVAVAPFWHDLKDFDGTSSQVYFSIQSDLSGSPAFAVITWLNVTAGQDQQPFTLQAVLSRTGFISFRYDNRFRWVNVDGGVIGVSEGTGSASAIDYSAISGSPPVEAPRSVFEAFSRPAVLDFGRDDEFTTIGFSPRSPFDGYSVGSSVAPIPGVVSGRRACSCDDLGFTITPSGGGYTLQQGAAFDSDYESGTPFVLDRFDNVPFTSPFPVPIGTRLISNWIISWGGSIFEDGPSGTGRASIAPASADWESVTAPNVWVHEIDPHTFSVTWRGFRQWEFLGPLPTDPPASTFQAVVSADGVIRLAYQELNFFVRLPGGTLSVGVFGGQSPPPPEVDFSSGSAVTSVPTIFESFNPVEDLDPQLDFPRRLNEGWRVEPNTAPRIGSLFRASAVRPGGSQAPGLFLLGLPADPSSPPVTLGSIDPHLASCRLLVDTVSSVPIVVPAVPQVGGTPIVDVPMIPELVGFELSLQALIVNSGSGPAIIPTDEVLLRFGL